MSHKKRGGGHEEEHENHERWAVSYADMMTVLMALFLVLFAMSSIDVKKFDQLRTSLAKGFGNEALPSDGGSGLLSGATNSPIDLAGDSSPLILDNPSSNAGNSASSIGTQSGSTSNTDAVGVAGPTPGTGAGDELAARTEASHLQQLQAAVNGALAAQGLQDAVKTTITERGLDVTVVANDIFFKNASADIQPRGYAVLDALGPVLSGAKEQISVEGYANNLALNGGPFVDNWGLSASRAASVVRHLQSADGVAGDRLQVKGMGDTHPLYANDDPRAVEGNRRVDVVVLSDAPAEVRALVPALVGTQNSAANQGSQP